MSTKAYSLELLLAGGDWSDRRFPGLAALEGRHGLRQEEAATGEGSSARRSVWVDRQRFMAPSSPSSPPLTWLPTQTCARACIRICISPLPPNALSM